MEALACSYSSGERTVYSSLNSSAQLSLLSSKASERPPQPTYLDKTSCSASVACLPSNSISFKRFIASIFARNFAFAPPSPKLSSVIRKLPTSISGASAGIRSITISYGRLFSSAGYTATVSVFISSCDCSCPFKTRFNHSRLSLLNMGNPVPF